MTINLKEIPSNPGIYKFFSNKTIIYIGKAKNLKVRVSSYFGNSIKDRKTQKIKALTDRIETFSTHTEAEALLLEQSLIKENLPRFNILLRDDKTYPYIHFSMSKTFPGISLKRTKNAVTKNYFGPFISAHGVRSSIKDLQKIYQIRNCSDSTFNNRSRPCIEHQMHRCSAPCVSLISKTDYIENISAAQNYLESSGKKTKDLMLRKMRDYAERQEFERASEMKKKITSLDMLHQEKAFDSNLVSVDFFSCSFKDGVTGASILSVREGKIRGTKTHYLRENLSLEIDSLYQSLILSYYQNSFSLPQKILLTTRPININLMEAAIQLKFSRTIPITCAIPKSAKALAALSKLNANQIIENKLSQANRFEYAMLDLASKLGLKKRALEIEGYDISHHAGSYAVASCVKFTNEGPDKKSYRLYNIPKIFSGNDIGSIQNILERRFKNIEKMNIPDILLIDGGKAQLNVAMKVFKNISPSPVILSIVKGANRVRATETILSKDGVIEIAKDSPAFTLLQKIRDESHRFAILSNRMKKNKKVKYSILDSIQGLGPNKKRNLLREFKSLTRIKKSSINELCRVEGISIKIANQIKNTL